MRRDFGAELLANILTIVRWPKSSLKGARDRSDGHAIASGAANCSVIVHRKHILTSERDWVPGRHQPERRRLRWVPFRRSFCPWVGPFYALSSISDRKESPCPVVSQAT